MGQGRIAVSCCRSARWCTWVFSGPDAITVSKTGAREGVWVRIPPAPLYSTTTYEEPSPAWVWASERELPDSLPAYRTLQGLSGPSPERGGGDSPDPPRAPHQISMKSP